MSNLLRGVRPRCSPAVFDRGVGRTILFVLGHLSHVLKYLLMNSSSFWPPAI